jgi:16S rRNA C967 or C1407 C5-methylase (RsmB/RsmF family)
MPKRSSASPAPSQPSTPQPSKLLLKLSQRLFADAQTQAQFVAALTSPVNKPLHRKSLGASLLWLRNRPEAGLFATQPALSWQPTFIDRLLPEQAGAASEEVSLRPGQHPAHAQGDYYCLDFSSVFAAAPLLTLPQHPQLVVDLCAAPGGKSLLAWRMLQPQQLICNEVVGKRLGMLIGNLQRCQIQPALVLQQDGAVISQHLGGVANLVLVDAPCSGQSLLAKGEKAEGCFHPVTIEHNAKRQKRILANAVALLAPQAYLLYTTCTFSPAENEGVSEWLQSKFPHLRPVPVPFLESFQSHLSALPCYRLWPQSGLGAGAFSILWQNTTPVSEAGLLADLDWLKQVARWQLPKQGVDEGGDSDASLQLVRRSYFR